ncbi:MAG: hypothetical protein R6W92_03665, partial [Desulfocurvibacter africanus]
MLFGFRLRFETGDTAQRSAQTLGFPAIVDMPRPALILRQLRAVVDFRAYGGDQQIRTRQPVFLDQRQRALQRAPGGDAEADLLAA